ncbi:MAG: hypothetical protein CMH91_14835 [Oceanicaulis sp.]|jgi:hypothetical protein|uniref:hypothetical protein n=1 Tax=unclassified Oceanicaulis TaxID=2632123 RepID=UPI000C4A742D|nr:MULTISPECIES: hypothetical protein [unclassified Oceanicaulis]MAB69635.1 hypothetical protein [Oceanicaulis sp.]MBC40322.1 hypothetical protein [Oceanicaulis sp.]MBG36720.1 hypothetical protein [Oceanicaulis sp.]HBU62633.1 hypothetical protein [Oceanicaulis sp.]HCR94235.1 hypothetical protein [Oceanicaulis sp.]|tara:strand:+ start:517 stop:987 length:471 start_codon:yes stop_codon:yes gene_type:complete
MLLRCIFVSIAGLLCACAGAPSPDRVQIQGTPPDNTLTPRLPRSDQGLSPDWFLGDWRVGASGCMLHLGRSDAEGASGPVETRDCAPPWSGASRWRRPADDQSLFDILTPEGALLWRAGAIQPTAIAGVNGEGRLVRLYWAQEGTHGGWVRPGGEE